MRHGEPAEGGFLDSEEWGAEIAEFFCERSAVVRLGATLVPSEGELPVGAFGADADFRAPGGSGPAPAIGAPGGPGVLHPGDWELEAGVLIQPNLRRAVAADPELSLAIKVDLAGALARRADEAFLQGAGPPGPEGIQTNGLAPGAGADLLDTGRQVLTAVRPVTAPGAPAPAFGAAGWVLASSTLDTLTTLVTADGLVGGAEGRTLDSFRLLQLDGADGGVFLGFPFVLSPGAAPGNLYFGADWREALVGVDPSFVTVRVSTEAPPAPPGQGFVVRASISLDFALRRPAGFAWA